MLSAQRGVGPARLLVHSVLITRTQPLLDRCFSTSTSCCKGSQQHGFLGPQEDPSISSTFEAPTSEYVTLYMSSVDPKRQRHGTGFFDGFCSPEQPSNRASLPLLTPEQRNLFTAVSHLMDRKAARRTTGTERSDGRPAKGASHTPEQLLAHASWLVNSTTSSKDGQAEPSTSRNSPDEPTPTIDGINKLWKGKAKAVDQDSELKAACRPNPRSYNAATTINFDWSLAVWALLLREAARRHDGSIFVDIMLKAVQWCEKAILKELERAHLDSTTSLQRSLSHLQVQDLSGSGGLTQQQRYLGGSHNVKTFDQFERHATTLAAKLQDRDCLPVHRLADLMQRYPFMRRVFDTKVPITTPDHTNEDPTRILQILKRPLPLPVRHSQIKKAATTLQDLTLESSSPKSTHRRRSYQRRVRWLTHASINLEGRRQLRDFSAVLRERAERNVDLQNTVALINHHWQRRMTETRPVQPETYSEPSRVCESIRSARRSSRFRAQQKTQESTPDSFIADRLTESVESEDDAFPLLGSICDPHSLKSRLLQRHQLADETIAGWLHSKGYYDGDQRSAGGPQTEAREEQPGSKPRSPPLWLFSAALRIFAERGDAARVKQSIKAYLSAYSDERNTAVATSQSAFLEVKSQPRDRDLLFYPSTRSDKSTDRNSPLSLLDGSFMLTLLVRAYHLEAVDRSSASKAFKKAWADCLELCGDKQARLRRAETLSDRSSSATRVSEQLPLLTPNESTLISLFHLLKFERDRTQKGFALAQTFQKMWGAGVVKKILTRIPQHPSILKASEDQIAAVENAGAKHASDRTWTIPSKELTIRTATQLAEWACQSGRQGDVAKAVMMAKRWRHQERDRRLNFNVAGTKEHLGDRKANLAAATSEERHALAEFELWLKELLQRDSGTVYRPLRRPGKAWAGFRRVLRRARLRRSEQALAQGETPHLDNVSKTLAHDCPSHVPV